jgi:two-component system C4-dicarboxylate transport sensor histidine kinase DctB
MANEILLVKKKTKSTTSYFSDWDRNLLSLIHELSGPMTSARLNLESFMVAKNTSSLSLLESNLKLMEDYLTTARQLIKKQPVTTRPFSVNKQLADIIKNLRPVAGQRGVSLSMNVIDDCVLCGNSTRFKQIISCFIRNGIEAYDDCQHDNKSVTIEHYHIPSYLVIGVTDHGSGIAEEDKAKIFKPYFSTKRSSSGLGLGLSLAAESISEDFDGQAKVDSDNDHGTVFSLYFAL